MLKPVEILINPSDILEIRPINFKVTLAQGVQVKGCPNRTKIILCNSFLVYIEFKSREQQQQQQQQQNNSNNNKRPAG